VRMLMDFVWVGLGRVQAGERWQKTKP
jgi:hypothetical protein